jgi:hypothetical protein
MADLKKNHALLILGDGSASDPVGASKLAAFASEVEGAQCLLFNGKVTARILEIAELGAIPNVLGSTLGVKSTEGTETYAMSDIDSA